jgi:hypothetical protein
MARNKKSKGKKTEAYIYLILKLILDLIIAWYSWDYYKHDNKVMLYGLVGGYLLIRLFFGIKGIKKRKLKRQFNDMFPDD